MVQYQAWAAATRNVLQYIENKQGRRHDNSRQHETELRFTTVYVDIVPPYVYAHVTLCRKTDWS